MSKGLTSHELRQKFINYFSQHDHQVVPSASLIPGNDPTLMFTNAGMVQFKDYFVDTASSPYQTATSCQKCVRAGGKHNDLDQVGHTARHHTFFEMLGNFSFGDYFKKKAIKHAWTFLIDELKLDKDRLWVTVFKGEEGIPADEEAYQVWAEDIGVPKERILRLGMEDNFWSMGDTGPCGPCSEILYDQGEAASSGDGPSTPEEDGDRYLEIWNLVFMQFNRSSDKKLHDLPAPCVDTGMGLERVAAVLQGKLNNYATDVFQGLIQKAAAGVGKIYGQNEEDDVSMRVIADHARSAAFLISDGVWPANSDRNYVLRRIMRRAIRHGDRLGYKEPFLHEICEQVIIELGSTYPLLQERKQIINDLVLQEEEQFRRTLARGLKRLDAAIEKTQAKDESTLDGDDVFALHDTYGFPPDLTEQICLERGFQIDWKGFKVAQEAQKDRGRASWKEDAQTAPETYTNLFDKIGATQFAGYDQESSQAKVLSILLDGKEVSAAIEGQQVELLFDQTPFYGESGGQVGDKGTCIGSTGKSVIEKTQKPVADLFVHHAIVSEGRVAVGDTVTLKVDHDWRQKIRLNHSATHLLHWSLRKYLGDHVKQAGSLVSPDRLRFDYTHYQAPSEQELQQIEEQVNLLIRENWDARTDILGFEEAKEAGAMALFGEKYGDKVRMVKIGPTIELCGGTHVSATGEIGQFRIFAEQNVASGIRRIEGLTGTNADQQARSWQQTVRQTAFLLKCRPEQIAGRVGDLQDQLKTLQKQVEQLKIKAASSGSGSGDLLDDVKEVEGIKYLAIKVGIGEPKAMRALSDQLRDRLKSGVLVLAGEHKEKVTLIVMVTKDLTMKLHAGKMMKVLAQNLGGKGGGRPDMAQGGGPNVSKLDETLKSVPSLLKSSLS